MAYSESFKAKALVKLAENDGAISKTARELDIDRKTLERWATGELAHPQEVASLLQQALFKVLASVPDFSKPGAANSWPQAVKTLVESIQLLTGEPTQRTESKNANIQVGPESGNDTLKVSHFRPKTILKK